MSENMDWGHVPYAVRKAFWQQLTGSVNEGNNNLLPMSVYMLCKRLTHMNEMGIKHVAVNQIRGRVGLSHNLTTMPQALDLLKIGEMYFVLGEDQPFPIMVEQDAVEARVIEVLEMSE